jgi:signal peptidase I
MFFDFEVLLVLVTLITGLTVLWSYLSARARPKGAEHKHGWWVDLCRSLFPVILAVLVIRSFMVEPFRIPSGSMIPTLVPGDFILVSKFSYGLRLPITNTRILGAGTPERGDLVVFKYPENPTQDYIKRVVGLPGDLISFRTGELLVNGEAVPSEEVGIYDGGMDYGARLFTERVNELEYTTLRHRSNAHPDGDYEVPEGHYFMVGDNRDRSADSRRWGSVSDELLVGRAFFVWMSWDMDENRINWSRIGERIE